jgi:VanZ family protein
MLGPGCAGHHRFGSVVSLTTEVSLTIGELQTFLPTRDSGISDVITDTLGIGIGAMLCNCESVQVLFETVGLGGQRQPVSLDRASVAEVTKIQ